MPGPIRLVRRQSESVVSIGSSPLHPPPVLSQIAVLVYGFPPGVGATGTAALLNVPRSLEALLQRLRAEGYDLGNAEADPDGDAIVAALAYASLLLPRRRPFLSNFEFYILHKQKKKPHFFCFRKSGLPWVFSNQGNSKAFMRPRIRKWFRCFWCQPQQRHGMNNLRGPITPKPRTQFFSRPPDGMLATPEMTTPPPQAAAGGHPHQPGSRRRRGGIPGPAILFGTRGIGATPPP